MGALRAQGRPWWAPWTMHPITVIPAKAGIQSPRISGLRLGDFRNIQMAGWGRPFDGAQGERKGARVGAGPSTALRANGLGWTRSW